MLITIAGTRRKVVDFAEARFHVELKRLASVTTNNLSQRNSSEDSASVDLTTINDVQGALKHVMSKLPTAAELHLLRFTADQDNFILNFNTVRAKRMAMFENLEAFHPFRVVCL